MPRTPKSHDTDPENFYAGENTQDVEQNLDTYLHQGLDSYRSAYTDYDYDSDNYGYLDN